MCLPPDPAGGAYSAPPDTIDGFPSPKSSYDFGEGNGEEEWKGLEMEKEWKEE